MILFLTRANLASPSLLDIKSVPKRFMTLGRLVYPRGFTSAVFWRTVFETPITRYALALSPFPIALIFKPEWALPISLAPVPMAMFVLMFESYVLSVPSPSARRALIGSDEADRGLDLLKTRADAVLTKIAASRDVSSRTLHLVIEQSELLRIPPLTQVSVQQDGPEPGFVELDRDEQAMIAGTLFDDALDERTLRLINVAQNVLIRKFELDPNSISAHARLAGLAALATTDAGRGDTVTATG